jgi:hypothetical protein
MTYTWKISDVFAVDGLITQVKYYCTGVLNDISIDTEGTWKFLDPKLNVPFDQVTEQMVAEWIDAETNGTVKENLQSQMQTVNARPVTAPWLPQIFTPNI